jgi:ribonuclease BN (tRNA processing enzyme)
MTTVSIKFLGSGDAFGSGGRLQTCILIETAGAKFLLDCGASALISMKRFGISTADIDKILLTHLHGDHFGGIPFFILDCKRIILTHMSDDMLSRLENLELEYAEDGKEIIL